MGDPEPASAFPSARLRPARGLYLLYGLLAFLVVLMGSVAINVREMRAVMVVFGGLLALPIGLGVRQLQRYAARGGGCLEARPEGLFAEGRLALARETIERAVVTRDARGVTVSIQRTQGFVSVVDVASEEEGHALVRALGLSVEQAVATFRLDSAIAAAFPVWAFYAYLILFAPFLAVPIVAQGAWIALVPVVAWYVGLMVGSVPTQITVGLDGSLVRHLGRREILRHADVSSIHHDGERLHVELVSGRRRSFSARWIGAAFERKRSLETGFGSRAAYLDAIVKRVREAIETSRGNADPAPAEALGRRGRDLDAWLSALRGTLHRGARSFREAETVPEQLWRTVEDGSADPSARAAAAIALGPMLGEEERARLRRAARVVIAPRLRIAIEAAANGDDDAVREALAALEDERSPAQVVDVGERRRAHGERG